MVEREISEYLQRVESASFRPAEKDRPACLSDNLFNHYSIDIYKVTTPEEKRWMEEERKRYMEFFECQDILILPCSDPRVSEHFPKFGDDWYTFSLQVKGKTKHGEEAKIEYLVDYTHEWWYYYTQMCKTCLQKTRLCHCEICEDIGTQGYEHLCQCNPIHKN